MSYNFVENGAFVNSIVGEGTRLTGELDLNGLLRIDGDFIGTIRTANGKVLIGKNGRAKCTITAGTVVVGGALKGNIYASEKVIILSSGIIFGNIYTAKLIVEEGVILDGNCIIKNNYKENIDLSKEPGAVTASSSYGSDAAATPSSYADPDAAPTSSSYGSDSTATPSNYAEPDAAPTSSSYGSDSTATPSSYAEPDAAPTSSSYGSDAAATPSSYAEPDAAPTPSSYGSDSTATPGSYTNQEPATTPGTYTESEIAPSKELDEKTLSENITRGPLL